MLIIGVGIMALIFVVVLARDSIFSSGSITDGELVRSSLEDLRAAGLSAYSQGVGATGEAQLTLPAGIKNITLQNRSIIAYTQEGARTRGVPYAALGTINVSGGRNYIQVTVVSTGVCFGSVNLC